MKSRTKKNIFKGLSLLSAILPVSVFMIFSMVAGNQVQYDYTIDFNSKAVQMGIGNSTYYTYTEKAITFLTTDEIQITLEDGYMNDIHIEGVINIPKDKFVKLVNYSSYDTSVNPVLPGAINPQLQQRVGLIVFLSFGSLIALVIILLVVLVKSMRSLARKHWEVSVLLSSIMLTIIFGLLDAIIHDMYMTFMMFTIGWLGYIGLSKVGSNYDPNKVEQDQSSQFAKLLSQYSNK